MTEDRSFDYIRYDQNNIFPENRLRSEKDKQKRRVGDHLRTRPNRLRWRHRPFLPLQSPTGNLGLPPITEPRCVFHGFVLLACLNSCADAQQDKPNNQERVTSRLLALAEVNPRLELQRVEHKASQSVFVQGYFSVPENRDSQEGRSIRIGMVVLPARSEDPSPDPVFFLHGGPGAAATKMFRRQVNGWIREQRDVVLIDQRGTGSSNRLQVRMPGSDDDL